MRSGLAGYIYQSTVSTIKLISPLEAFVLGFLFHPQHYSLLISTFLVTV